MVDDAGFSREQWVFRAQEMYPWTHTQARNCKERQAPRFR